MRKENLYLCMVMDVNQTYHGDHFIIDTNNQIICMLYT